MRQKNTALIIPACLNVRISLEGIEASPAGLHILVGGTFDALSFGDWHVFLNDEADVIPLPANMRAEILSSRNGSGVQSGSGWNCRVSWTWARWPGYRRACTPPHAGWGPF